MNGVKKRRVLTKGQEKERFDYVESMLVYLECGDFRVPVKTFMPMLRSTAYILGDRLAHAIHRGFGKPWEPIGIIFEPTSRSHAMRVAVTEMVDRQAIRRAEALCPGLVPIEAMGDNRRYAKVATFNVTENGKAISGIPDYFWATREQRDSTWFPVVAPTQLGHTKTIVSSGGRETPSVKHLSGVVVSSDIGVCPHIAAGVAELRRSVWVVCVSAMDGRSEMLLFTDDRGAVGFFNLRTAPVTTAGRRKALQHWVKEHSRNRSAPEPVEVKGHLRGVHEFNWLGLACRIESPTELGDS